MAASSTQLAHLLNLNVDDSSALTDILAEFMDERCESETEDDSSDSSDEDLTTDQAITADIDNNVSFTPLTSLADRIVPLDSGTPTITTSAQPSSIPCTCKFNDGKPCFSLFTAEDIQDCQTQFLALERSHLDIAILAKIQCGFHSEDITKSTKKLQQTERKKCRLDYFHGGHKICRKLFEHLHRIGKYKLDALIAHFKANGVELRAHKNEKKLPVIALKYEDTRRVVDFILNYAEIHAIQLPGRTPKHWITDARLLPTHTTKAMVYEEYKITCLDSEFRCVKLRTFRKLWQQLVPFVRTMLPESDLCWLCQDSANKITRAANKSDVIKEKLVTDLKEHHRIVQQERTHYQTCVATVKAQLPDNIQLGKHDACSFDGTNHISFDFAQQVHYPYNPLQPGPIFFKTPRKCGLFGVNCEALSKQVNYLIDEAHSCGKGANTVISYLHHYLEHFGLGEKHLVLHADNCSGQNKNSFMLWYLMWCMTGRHETIKLCFLITGHTKFSPDAGFGLIKRKFKKTKVDCLKDIEHIVNISSEMNTAQVVGWENEDSIVVVHNWSEFLARFFVKVKNIKSSTRFASMALDLSTCKSTLGQMPKHKISCKNDHLRQLSRTSSLKADFLMNANCIYSMTFVPL